MHRYRFICTTLMVTLLGGIAWGACTALDAQSTVEDLTAYLRSEINVTPAQQDAECIEFALRHLEYKGSPERTELVVQYLSFRRPLSPAEQQGFMVHGPMDEGSMHPAIGTLMTFGPSAVPALLSTIENPISSEIARNATHALMAIYRDNPVKGIEILKSRAAVTSSPQAERLQNAARQATEWCGKKHQTECDAASRKTTEY